MDSLMQAFVWLAVASGLLGSGPAAVVRMPPSNPAPITATQWADTGATALGPALPALIPAGHPALLLADTPRPQRPRAIEYSDAYYTRLMIHRYASFASIPLFVAEYFIGRSLYNNPTTSSRSLRSAHGTAGTTRRAGHGATCTGP
jgi:hypothetical protein